MSNSQSTKRGPLCPGRVTLEWKWRLSDYSTSLYWWSLGIIVPVFLSCSGHIAIERHEGTLPNEITGIPFRVVEPQMEYFIYTTRMEEDGQVSSTCERRVLTRLAGEAPSADWYTISYQPKLFEKQKFSVTLNDNGTLSSVATESTPISLQELASAAEKSGALPIWASQSTESTEALMPPEKKCTGTPEVVGRCPMTNNIPESDCADQMQERAKQWLLGPRSPAFQAESSPVPASCVREAQAAYDVILEAKDKVKKSCEKHHRQTTNGDASVGCEVAFFALAWMEDKYAFALDKAKEGICE